MTEFSVLVEALGYPEGRTRVPDNDAASYRGRVPNALIDFWTEYGRGSYQDGKFWICDPAPFQCVIENIFKGDQDFDPIDLVAIRRFSFANLTVWSRKLAGPISIDFNLGTAYAFGADTWIDEATGHRHSEDFIVAAIFNRVRRMQVWVTEDDKDMHPLAVARLGRLKSDETYGFFPALSLGGINRVSNLKIVKAVEHFLILSELPRFRLLKMNPRDGAVQFVRHIGS